MTDRVVIHYESSREIIDETWCFRVERVRFVPPVNVAVEHELLIDIYDPYLDGPGPVVVVLPVLGGEPHAARYFAAREELAPQIKLILLDQASLDWAQEENGWSWPCGRSSRGMKPCAPRWM